MASAMECSDMPANSVDDVALVDSADLSPIEVGAIQLESPLARSQTSNSNSLESVSSGISDLPLILKSTSKLHSCPESGCNSFFSKRFSLKEHMNLAHNSPNFQLFKCTEQSCDKAFDTKSRLKRHARVHKGYSCNICECNLNSWSNLRKHVAEKHPPKHVCMECGASFSRPYYLKRHQKLHENSEECPVEGCTVRVIKTRLNVHLKTVHKTTASQLSKRATQAGDSECDRRFLCDKCKRSFKKSAHLVAHKQAVHEGKKEVRAKVFICDVHGCERKFAFRARLEGHRNWHLGLKPFACPFEDGCDKRFTSRNTLNKHLQTSHITSMHGLKQSLQLAVAVANVSLDSQVTSTSDI